MHATRPGQLCLVSQLDVDTSAGIMGEVRNGNPTDNGVVERIACAMPRIGCVCTQKHTRI